MALLHTFTVADYDCDEAADENAIDNGPNLFDLTRSGTVGSGTGKIGGSRTNASNSASNILVAGVNNSTWSSQSGTLTISAWVKFTTILGGVTSQFALYKGNGTNAQSEWGLGYSNLLGAFVFTVHASPGGISTSVASTDFGTGIYTTGVWYHVTGTYSLALGKIAIAVNGVSTEASYASTIVSRTTDSAAQRFRLLAGTTSTGLNGEIDLVAYLKGVSWLDHPEILSQLYNAGAGNPYPYNRAPTVDAIADTTGSVGTAITFTAEATDEDYGDSLSGFSLAGSPPSGASINAATGEFAWTPTSPGTYTITVRAQDTGNPALFDDEEFSVVVAQPMGEIFFEAGQIDLPGFDIATIDLPGMEAGQVDLPGLEIGAMA